MLLPLASVIFAFALTGLQGSLGMLGIYNPTAGIIITLISLIALVWAGWLARKGLHQQPTSKAPIRQRDEARKRIRDFETERERETAKPSACLTISQSTTGWEIHHPYRTVWRWVVTNITNNSLKTVSIKQVIPVIEGTQFAVLARITNEEAVYVRIPHLQYPYLFSLHEVFEPGISKTGTFLFIDLASLTQETPPSKLPKLMLRIEENNGFIHEPK